MLESGLSQSFPAGAVHNPYGLPYTPYGSSGGNGAAAGAVYSLINLGSDTLGSGMLPPSAANVFSIRTTHGKIVPMELVFPLVLAQVTNHARTRTQGRTHAL